VRIVVTSWRDLAHPQAGGSEYVLDRLAAGLVARGHDVTLLAGGPVAARDYRVVDTGSRFGQYLRAPWRYVRHHRGADVVVDVENGIPFFAPLWCRRTVVCLVHHVHRDQWHLYFPRPVAAIGRFLEVHAMPLLYRRCRFVAVSPSTALELREIGVDDARIDTVVMGTDAVPAGIESAVPTFVALGRLVPHKRIDLLLEIWERVRPATGGTLVIAGDGPERGRLEAMAGDDVVFTGFVAPEEKVRLLGEAWLLVHPALHEGWGTVVMEAAATGTPTVGFEVVGVRDSVNDGETGVLARSADDFAAAWIDLVRDPERRSQLGANARARAGSLRWDDVVDRFERILQDASRTTVNRRRTGVTRPSPR
jgi:glycosyltransferase involved in cell wall biosynthesis